MLTDGSAFHKDMPLVAGAGVGKALRTGRKKIQRAELEACAAVCMALDCKLEVRLGNMWVKTGVGQMLS